MRIKICCIKSVDEARLAIRSGATAVGLVSEMPSGPGMIPEERIAEIVSAVAGEVETFLLTSKREDRKAAVVRLEQGLGFGQGGEMSRDCGRGAVAAAQSMAPVHGP